MKRPLQGHVKLSQLQILLATAKAGSFSEAALSLSISQSAVSHAISALEEGLGVILCSRGRHGARLSPVGQRILNHAQIILDETTAIEKEANLAKGIEGGAGPHCDFSQLGDTHLIRGSCRDDTPYEPRWHPVHKTRLAVPN